MFSANERIRAKVESAALDGLAADPAGVLAQDAVADMVRPVLDPPVGADRAPEALGILRDLADVAGGLAAGLPQAGAGVFAPGQTRDPGGTGDHPLPRGRQPTRSFRFWADPFGPTARIQRRYGHSPESQRR